MEVLNNVNLGAGLMVVVGCGQAHKKAEGVQRLCGANLI